MIEPSDTERAELPECTAKYIEDLEEELENRDRYIVELKLDLDEARADRSEAFNALSIAENKLYPALVQLKDAHKKILQVISQNDFYKTDDEIL